MGVSPSKAVQRIQNQQREKQIKFLEQLSQNLNKTPQEVEQITWMMQNKQYDIDYVLLGAGGNGVVIRGFDKQQQKPIAIKIMKFKTNDQCERLLNEFKLLQQCEGTQILKVKEIYISYKHKLQFMIMEYCPFDLKTYLQRIEEQSSQIKMAYVLQLCLELVQGLKQIHDNGIIHLDIKPANILFSPNSVWKYSDFGISRKFKRTINQAQRETQTAQAKSGSESPSSPSSEEKAAQLIKIIPEGYTASYASPEQYQIVKRQRLDLNVTEKSDIYSLGVVFLELTGVKLSNEIIQRMKTDSSIDITSKLNPIYEQFNSVLKNMLSYNPTMRPNLDEVQMAIQRILSKNKDRGINSITNSPTKSQLKRDLDFAKIAFTCEDDIINNFQQPQEIYYNFGAMDLSQQDIPEIDAATTKKINMNEQQNFDFVRIK